MKTKNAFKKNGNEIKYNLINSLLAGGIALIGAFSDGEITIKAFIAAFCVSFGVALIKFKEYWETQAGEYSSTKGFANFL